MKQRTKWMGRPSDSVIQQRVAEIVYVLSNRPTVHRCQLHAEFCPRWQCHWKTVDKVVGRARKLMMERLRRSKEDFRVESLAFYEAKINDKNATVAEQIRARQRVDELLGLDAPRKAEISGPEGGKIELEHKVTKPIDFRKLEELARGLFGVPAKDGNGEPLHPLDSRTETSPVPGSNGD